MYIRGTHHKYANFISLYTNKERLYLVCYLVFLPFTNAIRGRKKKTPGQMFAADEVLCMAAGHCSHQPGLHVMLLQMKLGYSSPKQKTKMKIEKKND